MARREPPAGVAVLGAKAQGWDDGHKDRGGETENYHSSAEMVVKHNYITEYMDLIGKPPATPYVQRFYVLRFK